MKKNKKTIIIIAIVLILIIGGTVGFYFYQHNLKGSNKKETNVTDIKKATSVTSDSIITLLKEYYYEKGFVDKKNLSFWNIDKVEYIGYYESNGNFIYKVSGSYACLDKTDSCVYQEQASEPKNNVYSFILYLDVEENNSKLAIKNISNTFVNNKVVEDNTTLDSDTNLHDKVKKAIKEFYTSKNLLNEKNLTSWNFTKVEYVQKENDTITYQIESNYKCSNNDSSCVYVEQEQDKNSDGSYKFNFYVEMQNDTVTNLYTATDSNQDSNSEVGSTDEYNLTKEEILDLFIAQSKKSGLYHEENVASIKATNALFVGYYQSKFDTKIYKLEGTYTCKDNTSDCVYLEQVGEPTNNEYPISIYVMRNFKTKETSLSGAIMYSQELVEFNSPSN